MLRRATQTGPGPWRPLGRYRRRILLGLAFLLATNAAAMSLPWLLKEAIETMRQPEPAARIERIALAMIGLALVGGVTRILSRLYIFDAARQAEYDLRNDLFGRLLTLAPSFYRRQPTGDLMARLTADASTLRALWGAGLLNAVGTALAFVTAITLMASISPWLTVVSLLPYPFLVLVARRVGRAFFRLSREAQDQMGALSASAQEDLAGIGVVKAYTLEAERSDRFRVLSDVYLGKQMALTKARGRMLPIFGLMGSVGVIISLWIGGGAVARGELTLGALVAFQAYLGLLTFPTLAIGWLLSLFQRGTAAWSRVRLLLDERPTITGGDGPPLGPAIAGELEVRDLTIEVDGRKLLDRVSFRVPAGHVVALVGRTGSGKSTVVEAIPRLLEVPPGAVFLDGRDVTTLPLADLRRAIAYAPQDAFLFSATIAENIAFALPAGAERERDPAAPVPRAARDAGLVRDLGAFPDGLDTVVGERGITLSGGQRQRVALARALASDAPVLLLDDSLSAVDADTEREILLRLGSLVRGDEGAGGGRTTIVISHRVAAIAMAHQIVVLDEGRVVEVGSHAELVSRRGLYTDLYREQLAEGTMGASS